MAVAVIRNPAGARSNKEDVPNSRPAAKGQARVRVARVRGKILIAPSLAGASSRNANAVPAHLPSNSYLIAEVKTALFKRRYFFTNPDFQSSSKR